MNRIISFVIIIVAVALASLANPGVASSQTAGKPLDPKVDAELNRMVTEMGNVTRFEGDVYRVLPKGGWVRTRRILSDFVMTAEFRLPSPEAELGVGIRTIVHSDSARRVGRPGVRPD